MYRFWQFSSIRRWPHIFYHASPFPVTIPSSFSLGTQGAASFTRVSLGMPMAMAQFCLGIKMQGTPCPWRRKTSSQPLPLRGVPLCLGNVAEPEWSAPNAAEPSSLGRGGLPKTPPSFRPEQWRALAGGGDMTHAVFLFCLPPHCLAYHSHSGHLSLSVPR